MQVVSVFDAEEQTLPRRKKLWVRPTGYYSHCSNNWNNWFDTQLRKCKKTAFNFSNLRREKIGHFGLTCDFGKIFSTICCTICFDSLSKTHFRQYVCSPLKDCSSKSSGIGFVFVSIIFFSNIINCVKVSNWFQYEQAILRGRICVKKII